MRRDYWTVYDDDTRDFEQEILNLEDEDLEFNRVLNAMFNRMCKTAETNTDHFEQEKDLFEL